MPIMTPGAQVQTAPMMNNLAANQQAAEQIGSFLQQIVSKIGDAQKRNTEEQALQALSKARGLQDVPSILQSLLTQRQNKGGLSRFFGGGQMSNTEAAVRGLMVPTRENAYSDEMNQARLDYTKAQTGAAQSLARKRNTPPVPKQTAAPKQAIDPATKAIMADVQKQYAAAKTPADKKLVLDKMRGLNAKVKSGESLTADDAIDLSDEDVLPLFDKAMADLPQVIRKKHWLGNDEVYGQAAYEKGRQSFIEKVQTTFGTSPEKAGTYFDAIWAEKYSGEKDDTYQKYADPSGLSPDLKSISSKLPDEESRTEWSGILEKGDPQEIQQALAIMRQNGIIK